MSVTASAEDVERALEKMRTMLAADGYALDVRVSDGRLDLSVRATDGACEDCLVPKPVLRDIVVQMLGREGVSTEASDVVLTYPADA
jgi:Fe-S cluster biogenesis protein NfuA